VANHDYPPIHPPLPVDHGGRVGPPAGVANGVWGAHNVARPSARVEGPQRAPNTLERHPAWAPWGGQGGGCFRVPTQKNKYLYIKRGTTNSLVFYF
jgi:hypothetical protein